PPPRRSPARRGAPRPRRPTATPRSPAATQSACPEGDAGVCLTPATPASTNYSAATSLCQAPVPQCLQSARYENQQGKFQNLSNFEAVLQVPPHAAQVDYYFLFEDQVNNWADDTDYQVQFDWWDEPESAEQVPDPVR